MKKILIAVALFLVIVLFFIISPPPWQSIGFKTYCAIKHAFPKLFPSSQKYVDNKLQIGFNALETNKVISLLQSEGLSGNVEPDPNNTHSGYTFMNITTPSNKSEYYYNLFVKQQFITETERIPMNGKILIDPCDSGPL